MFFLLFPQKWGKTGVDISRECPRTCVHQAGGKINELVHAVGEGKNLVSKKIESLLGDLMCTHTNTNEFG